jgi:hypothetical protein
VTYLDERLDLATALQLLCTHAFRHFPWVALDACDNGMRVRSLLGALVQLLNYDDLFARLAALQGDCDLEKLRDQCLAVSFNGLNHFSGLEYLKRKINPVVPIVGF